MAPTIERPTPNQSYLVKQMQYKIAACLGALMHQLGSKCARPDGNPWQGPQRWLHTPDWSVQHQEFELRSGIVGDPYGGKIIFRNTRWGPGSDLDYGDKELDQQVFENVPDKTKLIKNGTSGPLHVAYEEEVSLTNSFSSSITKGVSLDMSVEVASEQKVSGSYAGVSAEVSLSEKFGVDKSESKEETKEQGEEGTSSEKLGIEFDAEAGQNYLVEISYENSGFSQPFTIDGIQDFDIEMQLYKAPHGNVKVQGIDGLLQFLYGYDTDYPWMDGFMAKAWTQVHNSLDWISKPENRRIQVTGINHASLDSKPTYNVQKLGNDIPDEYKHLPVEDAQQYQEEA